MPAPLGADEVSALPAARQGRSRHPPDADAAAARSRVRRVPRVLRRRVHRRACGWRRARSRRRPARSTCARSPSSSRATSRTPPRPCASVRRAAASPGSSRGSGSSGYSGPVDDAVDELGLRVEVEAVPGRGALGLRRRHAGASRDAGIGRARPARTSSTPTSTRSRTAPMAIRASVRLDVRYRVERRAVAGARSGVPHRDPRLSGGRVARRARRPALSRPAGGRRQDRGVA